jgi:glucose-6-phosphate 1-dehydrogenase
VERTGVDILAPAVGNMHGMLQTMVEGDVRKRLDLARIREIKHATGGPMEMIAVNHPGPDEMDAYERVLRDAMAGDATLFAREDYVEEAWRIVDPVLKASTPVYEYEPGTWGPAEVEERLAPMDGWHNPVLSPVPARAEAA